MSQFVDLNGCFDTYTYQQTAENIYKIGPAQCEFTNKEKEEYFLKAQEASVSFSRLSKISFNPVNRLIQTLKKSGIDNVSIAVEPGFEQYYAGLIRRMTDGTLLHVDWAPLDARGWTIEHINAQISWNLYVDLPEVYVGGQCIVYNRPWKDSDEQEFKVKGSYHYDESVVCGARFEEIEFVKGDLVIFNSRNYHRVCRSSEKRLTISSFMGRHNDGSIVLWS